MAYTKASMRAVDKYSKKNYDSFLVRVPKGRKKDIDEHAKSKDKSVNGLINEYLRDDMGMSEADWKKVVDGD